MLLSVLLLLLIIVISIKDDTPQKCKVSFTHVIIVLASSIKFLLLYIKIFKYILNKATKIFYKEKLDLFNNNITYKLYFGLCISFLMSCQSDKNEFNFVFFNSKHGNYSFLATELIDSSMIEQTTFENKNYFIYAYEFVYNDYIFGTSFYNFPIENNLQITNEIDVLLDNMVFGAINIINGRLESSKKIFYYKIQGKEFITNCTDGRIISRLYLDENNNVYSLMVQSKNINEDFDNPIIQTFLNSFYLEGLTYTKPPNSEVYKKSDVLTCSDMEKFMRSGIAASDNFLQSNNWEMVQEITNSELGKGYQYFINVNGNHEQLIIYPEKNVVIYFPNTSNYQNMLDTVKNDFIYQDSIENYGVRQDLYSNGRYRVMINSNNKSLMFAWGIGQQN